MANVTLAVIFGAVALIGFAACVVMWVSFRVLQDRDSRWIAGPILWICGLGPALIAVLSPRVVSLETGVTSVVGGFARESGLSIWTSRLMTAVVLTLCLAVILGSIFSRRSLPKGGTPMWVSYMLFVALGLGLSSFAGTKPDFVHSLFYAPIVLTAIYLLPAVQPAWLMRHAAYITLFFIYGSLAAAALFPGWALQYGLKSYVPFVDFRLAGLTTHPNILGPIALLGVLLIGFGAIRGWSRWVHIVAGLAVVVLAQSKTAWIAAAATAIIVMLIRAKRELSFPAGATIRAGWLIATLFAGIGVTGAALAAAMTLGPENLLGLVDRGITTFTGRTFIWDVTFRIWEQSPWFGYGPSLWDVEMRFNYGLPMVGGAHNQFVQTLGDSGVIGFFFLMIYIAVLFYFALKLSGPSNGLSVALLIMALARAWTETPFRNLVLLDATFFLHLVLFAYFIVLLRQGAQSVPARS